MVFGVEYIDPTPTHGKINTFKLSYKRIWLLRKQSDQLLAYKGRNNLRQPQSQQDFANMFGRKGMLSLFYFLLQPEDCWFALTGNVKS